MCHRSYFNLAGHDSPEGIMEHKLQIFADAYTPRDEFWIPTRKVQNLDEVPEMDFREPKILRDALNQLPKANDNLI